MTNPRPSSVERERIREEKRAELLRKNQQAKRRDLLATIGILLVLTPLAAGIVGLLTGLVWWAALWFWTNLPI